MTTIALDTNILVKIMRDEDESAHALRALLAQRVALGADVAIPVFCVGELWRIVTDHRAVARITPQRALTWIDNLLSRGAKLLTPGPGYWESLKILLAVGSPEGLDVFDHQIAALCLERGIEEIWTFDRAFVPHSHLRVVDPLDLPEANSPPPPAGHG